MRAVVVLAFALLSAAAAHGEPLIYDPVDDPTTPDGVHVLDGSCVLDVGELHVNITNHGLIGSQFSSTMPYSQAPSGQWPGGTGNEYLWGAGLWVGAVVRGQARVTTGQYERELRPTNDLLDTIYEGRGGIVTRPWAQDRRTGRRSPDSFPDDDGDGRVDEETLNGKDDDGDGLIDEDWGQMGDQMFTCKMLDNLPLIREIYPAHQPLGLRVVQRAAAWFDEEFDDIVALDYEITNVGYENLEDVYLGFFTDCDIQRRGSSSAEPDDQAGLWDGAVLAPDNSYYRIQVAWMRDGAQEDPLPGCFGVMLLDHSTDFLEYYAPHITSLRSYQIFATNATTYQDGEPQTDRDRYDLLASKNRDRNMYADEYADLKFLISSGPFPLMKPGRTYEYRLALVIGNGLQGMLQTALNAAMLGRGRYFNHDKDWSGFSGYGGRETLVCLGDYPPYEGGDDPLFSLRPVIMDEYCTGEFPVMGFYYLQEEDLITVDGRDCVWVNGDNCEECFRRYGVECDMVNRYYWDGGPNRVRGATTGTSGREAHVPWVYAGASPPPLPHIRVMTGHNRVEVFWDDVSELEPDYVTGVLDFESYRVWRVASWVRPPETTDVNGPPAELWGMIAEFDVINEIPAGVGGSQSVRSLGMNTGLEIAVYTPACLADSRFAGLAAAMQQVVDADPQGEYRSRPALRLPDGHVTPGLEVLMPWERSPAVLDTFFAVAERAADPAGGVVAKRATRYYHYLDDEVHDGFQGYYSVTASDHALEYVDGAYLPAGYGIQEDPSNSFLRATPAPEPQTVAQRQRDGVNIYVYPNPATRDALAEFAQQYPSKDDPTGVRVMFNNLPAARNTITIYTLSGDLIQTIEHDGLTGGGAASWNLMSRSGQEVVSGIYLYAVQSAGGRFEDFQGRFVVIR